MCKSHLSAAYLQQFQHQTSVELGPLTRTCHYEIKGSTSMCSKATLIWDYGTKLCAPVTTLKTSVDKKLLAT